uniref:Cytochrome b n=1 Tax=Ochromonas danica TaxID=2986 RepID=Q9G926_OCHDN|nr:apocytochrome b [Ochromonas danica]AAG18379.1 apocytochrome b [Ochromonas danica]
MLKNFRWNRDYLLSFIDSHIIDYPTPINLNYFWSFGSTAGICLVIQILTGIFLAMHYCAEIDLAFESVEHIMTDVNNGWLIRYIHANGASMFFIVVYCHIFRGLYYGSYIAPRGRLWATGVIIFLLMMATAFMGYVLPWGQMSFWGATVITNLFSAIPYVGGSIVEWLWGGFSVGNATLNRFFSLHYFLPFIIAAFTIIHLSLLHKDGSNNPLGINSNVDYIPFYPYFYVKDLFSFFIFAFIFSFFVFFYPNVLGHSDNYIPANPMVTPAHIVPEWYFLPFYAILRSIPDKLGGVVAMVGAILVLLLLPVINTSFIRSAKFRPLYAFSYWFFVSDFILLGWIGQKPVESPFIEVGMGATFFYFIFLLVLVPLIGILETFLLNNNDGLIEIEENAVTDFYFGQDPLDEEDTIDYDGRKFVEKHSKLWDVEDPFEIEDYSKLTKVIFYL